MTKQLPPHTVILEGPHALAAAKNAILSMAGVDLFTSDLVERDQIIGIDQGGDGQVFAIHPITLVGIFATKTEELDYVMALLLGNAHRRLDGLRFLLMMGIDLQPWQHPFLDTEISATTVRGHGATFAFTDEAQALT